MLPSYNHWWSYTVGYSSPRTLDAGTYLKQSVSIGLASVVLVSVDKVSIRIVYLDRKTWSFHQSAQFVACTYGWTKVKSWMGCNCQRSWWSSFLKYWFPGIRSSNFVIVNALAFNTYLKSKVSKGLRVEICGQKSIMVNPHSLLRLGRQNDHHIATKMGQKLTL
jgi:hypothetical protein